MLPGQTNAVSAGCVHAWPGRVRCEPLCAGSAMAGAGGSVLWGTLQPSFTDGRKPSPLPLFNSEHTVGRTELGVDTKYVSRHHFSVGRMEGGGCYIKAASSNGTFLNGTKLATGTQEILANGDIITLVKARESDALATCRFHAVTQEAAQPAPEIVPPPSHPAMQYGSLPQTAGSSPPQQQPAPPSQQRPPPPPPPTDDPPPPPPPEDAPVLGHQTSKSGGKRSLGGPPRPPPDAKPSKPPPPPGPEPIAQQPSSVEKPPPPPGPEPVASAATSVAERPPPPPGAEPIVEGTAGAEKDPCSHGEGAEPQPPPLPAAVSAAPEAASSAAASTAAAAATAADVEARVTARVATEAGAPHASAAAPAGAPAGAPGSGARKLIKLTNEAAQLEKEKDAFCAVRPCPAPLPAPLPHTPPTPAPQPHPFTTPPHPFTLLAFRCAVVRERARPPRRPRRPAHVGRLSQVPSREAAARPRGRAQRQGRGRRRGRRRRGGRGRAEHDGTDEQGQRRPGAIVGGIQCRGRRGGRLRRGRRRRRGGARADDVEFGAGRGRRGHRRLPGGPAPLFSPLLTPADPSAALRL